MSPLPSIASSSRWIVGLSLAALWSLPGAVMMLQERSYSAALGEPAAWLGLARDFLPTWWPWILFSLLAARFARRLRFEAGARARALGLHALAALSLGGAHLVWMTGYLHIVHRDGGPPDFTELLRSMLWRPWPMMELLAYAGAVAVTHVRDARAELRVRERETARLETELVRAQLGALRCQVQPHFLFNTLNAIATLLEDDPPAARRMLLGLADLLRLTLDRGEQDSVSLAEEVDWLRRYLELETERFPDRLRAEIDLPDACAHARVPPLILQPLVENALRHGLAKRRGALHLAVRARHEGELLKLSVEDDGVGLPEELHEGVGLSNVRRRVERLHLPGALRLRRRAGGGVCAELELPWETSA
ncbi:MAG: hypothetical protein DHS20C15_25850 [Planctomycetota bacterium]|nr:MAG: hypothetical protein DHS20C15_25850 [Planctomycetota bacterium]